MRYSYFISVLLFISVNGFSQVKEITLGDPVPNVRLGQVINYKEDNAELSHFKGKLLILDFWATWCSPCVAAIPKLNELQKEFAKDVQILYVTKESRKKVETFLRRMETSGRTILFPSVVNDTILSKYFVHNALPHTVWISPSGKVIAVTGGEHITKENINRALNGETAFLPLKKDVLEDIFFEPGVSIFPVVNAKLANEDLEYVKVPDSSIIIHSTLTKYIAGMPTGANVKDSTLVTVSGSSIYWLFRVALWQMKMEMMNASLTVIDVKDSALYRKLTDEGLSYEQSINWMPDNAYSYELKLPASLADQKFEIMLDDLNRYFGIVHGVEGVIEKREQKYLALVRTGTEDLLASKGGPPVQEKSTFHLKLRNQRIATFVGELLQPFQFKPMLVDETNYKGKIDLELNCKLSDLEALNKELKKYGLRIDEKSKLQEIAVIRRIPEKNFSLK